MSVPGASLRGLQQSLITYAIRDGVAMRSAVDALLHSGFNVRKPVKPGTVWSDTLGIRVREGTDDEQTVITLVSQYAPSAEMRSRGDWVEAIEGYRDGNP